jgi:Phytanoyl-CoA dioxygenase (PhyH)
VGDRVRRNILGRMSPEAGANEIRENGFAVYRGVVAPDLCDDVIAAIADGCGVVLDDESTWDRVSTVIDQVPMWGSQAQWNIRQLPVLHDIWAAIWNRTDLWCDMNSCRVTPPWKDGLADALPIHFDVDPHDESQQWFPGLVALTDAPEGHGGFRCIPSMFKDPSSWPTQWSGSEFQPDTTGHAIIEVPLAKGDLLVWDSHLPHGTVRNLGSSPRAAMYVQHHSPGTDEDLRARLADFEAGLCPPWWRWKPGHDRVDPRQVRLTDLGQKLLGTQAW